MRLKILVATTLIVETLLLTGCAQSGDASFKDGAIIIPININCIGATVLNIDTYIALQSGDTLVKDSNNTAIKIYHDASGTKKVCLVSGTAHIVR